MRVSWPVLALLALACTGGTSPGTEADADADTDTDTDTDADSDTDTGDLGPRTDVGGMVRDATGGPVVDAQVRFCRGQLCLNAATDSAGAWSFDNVAALPTSLEILSPFNAGLTTGFAVVELVEDTPRTDLNLALFPRGPSSALIAKGATWHTVGEGLRIEAALDDLEPPAFVDPATAVSGVKVPMADWPPLDGLTDVLAVWYVDPFDHHAPNGLPVEVDNSWGAVDGSTITLRVGDYASSTWLDAGTLTANGAVFTGSAELPLLSTVVATGVLAVP